MIYKIYWYLILIIVTIKARIAIVRNDKTPRMNTQINQELYLSQKEIYVEYKNIYYEITKHINEKIQEISKRYIENIHIFNEQKLKKQIYGELIKIKEDMYINFECKYCEYERIFNEILKHYE